LRGTKKNTSLDIDNMKFAAFNLNYFFLTGPFIKKTKKMLQPFRCQIEISIGHVFLKKSSSIASCKLVANFNKPLHKPCSCCIKIVANFDSSHPYEQRKNTIAVLEEISEESFTIFVTNIDSEKICKVS
jgi:hypothetical protein